jgi:hypothetical protein
MILMRAVYAAAADRNRATKDAFVGAASMAMNLEWTICAVPAVRHGVAKHASLLIHPAVLMTFVWTPGAA